MVSIFGILFTYLLFHHVVQGKSICNSSRFDVNGLCIEQFYFCPLKSIYLNGVCFPVTAGSCLKGQVFVNNKCCTEQCVLNCEETARCSCCGNSLITLPQTAFLCNQTIISSCNFPVLPCLEANNKPANAPEPIECPAGTKLVIGTCRLIHCSNGILLNGRCVRLQCPSGTYWNQNKCVSESKQEQHITFKHTYSTQLNESQPTAVLRIINNIIFDLPPTKIVNMTLPATSWDQILIEDQQHSENIVESEVTDAPATWNEILREDEQELLSSSPCCTVISPRICQLNQNTKQWHCLNRKYEYCGNICVTKTVCLLAAKSRQCLDYVVVAPPSEISSQHDSDSTIVDCTGCVSGDYSKCSKYCYHYPPCSDIHSIDCQQLEQHELCANNSGMGDCLETVGPFLGSLANSA